MDYKKMWLRLRTMIMNDLGRMANPEVELDSMVALRIAGEKVVLNTMNKIERGETK